MEAILVSTVTNYGQHFPNFYMHHFSDRKIQIMAYVAPVVEYWLEREIAHLMQINAVKCVPGFTEVTPGPTLSTTPPPS